MATIHSRKWPRRPNRSINLLMALPILSIYLQLLGGQLFASSTTTSTPYPDANARPTITTKLENLSGIFKLSSVNVTTTTEGYPKLFSDDDNHGNKAFWSMEETNDSLLLKRRENSIGGILSIQYVVVVCVCVYCQSIGKREPKRGKQYTKKQHIIHHRNYSFGDYCFFPRWEIMTKLMVRCAILEFISKIWIFILNDNAKAHRATEPYYSVAIIVLYNIQA